MKDEAMQKAEEYWHKYHDFIQVYDSDERNAVMTAYIDCYKELKKQNDDLYAQNLMLNAEKIDLITVIKSLQCCMKCENWKHSNHTCSNDNKRHTEDDVCNSWKISKNHNMY